MSGVKRPGEGQARVDAGPVQRAKGARDVHDKAFQRDAKQYIIAFLADTRYQGQVSMKRLNELSQKEFLSIFSFVLRLLEPGAKEAIPSSGDGIQYIVDTLRALGHPAVPAKSILAAISTPSTVATVIGLLAWLVARVEIEVLRRPDRVRRPPHTPRAATPRTQRVLIAVLHAGRGRGARGRAALCGESKGHARGAGW